MKEKTLKPETPKPKKPGLLARLKRSIGRTLKPKFTFQNRLEVVEGFKAVRREYIKRNPRARFAIRVSMREWARTHARGMGPLSGLCRAFLGAIKLRTPGTLPLARSGKAPSLAERKRRARRNTTTQSRRNG